MRRLALIVLLAAAPVAAVAQSFDSSFRGDISSGFGQGGGNDTSDQFIGNRSTAEGSGRDMTREPPVRSNGEIAIREGYPLGDMTRR